MKSANIVKKLEKEGYKITFKKWGYLNNIPHVQLEGFDFTIAEYIHLNSGLLGVNMDFIYNHVQEALNVAKNNNPILLKKIKQVPWDDWTYSKYLILNMEDYYRYKKDLYPFDNDYYQVLEQLKNKVE